VIRGGDIGWLEVTRSAEFVDESLSGGVPITRCQFGPEGRFVAAGWRNTVGFLDPVHLRPLGSSRPRQQTLAFCFDPKGEFLLDAQPNGIAVRSLLWTNATTLECGVRTIILAGNGWSALACSAQGQWFAAANSLSNAAVLLDRTLTNRLAILGPHPGADAVAVSPDARWVATGSSSQRRVKVWDARSGHRELDLPAGRSARATFSADGKWLASFGDNFELRETETWRPAPALPFPDDRPLLGAAAFSTDSRLLAVVRDQYSVQLFDLSTFRSLGILTPPGEHPIEALEFSPDDGRLAAGCLTGRLRSWNLRSTRQRLTEFGLDWDLPPPAPASSPTAQRVIVAR
jgi:WD40 repeat protein